MEDRAATATYRIRFDEAGPDGLVKPSTHLRLAQDVAWIHSERVGYTRAWYADRGLTWLVRAVALDVATGIENGESVDVTTTVVGYRRIWARRRAEVRHAGVLVATILTDWILTDDRGRPVRIPPEFGERLPGEPVAIEAIRGPASPDRPPDVAQASRVRASELDPLDHMNNAAYLDRATDLAARLPFPQTASGSGAISAVVEYQAAAGRDAPIGEAAWLVDEATVVYRMAAEDDSTIVRAKFVAAAAP